MRYCAGKWAGMGHCIALAKPPPSRDGRMMVPAGLRTCGRAGQRTRAAEYRGGSGDKARAPDPRRPRGGRGFRSRR